MGLKPEQLAPVMHQLGFRIMPAGEPHPRKYGPPAPAMLGRRKMEPRASPEPVAAPVAISEDNPFAALAALRRAAR
jgi:ATP-dependent RNA helicase SUPV3L1/SUV3